MGKSIEDYILLYKRIEQNIKRMPGAPADANMKWFEDHVTDKSTQAKLRLCRLIRNYAQHEPDFEAFLSISDGMFDFLNGINKFVCKSNNDLRMIAIPVNSATYFKASDTVGDLLTELTRGVRSVVYFSNGLKQYGVFDMQSANSMLRRGATLNSQLYEYESLLKTSRDSIVTAYASDSKDMFANEISSGIKIVVLNDNGDLVGII